MHVQPIKVVYEGDTHTKQSWPFGQGIRSEEVGVV